MSHINADLYYDAEEIYDVIQQLLTSKSKATDSDSANAIDSAVEILNEVADEMGED